MRKISLLQNSKKECSIDIARMYRNAGHSSLVGVPKVEMAPFLMMLYEADLFERGDQLARFDARQTSHARAVVRTRTEVVRETVG